VSLAKLNHRAIVNIYTDSQATINSIKTIMTDPTPREILKIADYPIVEAIENQLRRFITLPIIHKVKAHARPGTYPFNERADTLAKEARELEEISDIIPFKNGDALQRDKHLYQGDTRTDKYPRTVFAQKLQKNFNHANHERLLRYWEPHFPELNILLANDDNNIEPHLSNIDMNKTAAATYFFFKGL